MDCPKCERKAFYDSNGKISHYEKPLNCEHCDGTGEIKNGDIWLCQYQDPCDYQGPLVFIDDQSDEYKWGFSLSSQAFLRPCDVVPIARMKEVE